MFVTTRAIACSHLGGGVWFSPRKFGILDSLRHSEGHFQADLDHLLVIVYACILGAIICPSYFSTYVVYIA